MMGSKQSRRCNLRVVLDGAMALRRELSVMRSRLDWAMDSSLFFGSIGFTGSTVSLSLTACRMGPTRLLDLYAIFSRRAALRVCW